MMITVWLTKEQLEDAQRRVNRLKTDMDIITIPVKPLPITGLLDASALPDYKSISIDFRRKRRAKFLGYEEGVPHSLELDPIWELVTYEQVCDEWLARQMQSINS